MAAIEGSSDVDTSAMKIGIDLGGTKIEGILLDEKGFELDRERIATPRGDYDEILDAVTRLADRLRQAAGKECSIGIATPGSLNVEGLLRNSNTVELNGKPLRNDLEQRLGETVRISNDANCFTLSEATDGAAAAYDNVFGVIIGTGTGGGLVINNHLVSGSNHIAGEWGHNPLPWARQHELPGSRCYCGKRGCIETFLSGPALSVHYNAVTGYQLTAKQIVQRAEHGDSVADGVLADYEDRLARALASVINVLDPQCIVLGGGLSNVNRLYERVPELWGDYVFSDSVNTALLPPRHGDSSGVRGAAWLWD